MNYHLQTALNKECTHSRRALHAFSWILQYKTDVNVFSASQNTANLHRSYAGQIEIHECQTRDFDSVPASYHIVYIIVFFLWIISCNKSASFVKVLAHCVRNFYMCFFRIHHRHAQKPGSLCPNACYGCEKCWKSIPIRITLWRTKVSEAVCKRDWHKVRLSLFFSVQKFQTKIWYSVCKDLYSSSLTGCFYFTVMILLVRCLWYKEEDNFLFREHLIGRNTCEF